MPTPTRKVYGVAGPSVIDMSLGATSPNIDGTEPVTLQVWRDFAFAAGGLSPQIISSGFVSSKLISTGPTIVPSARDLCILAQRVVIASADPSGLFFWSGLGEAGATEWDQTFEFREAEARPDAIVGCKETSRELFIFGENSLQVFSPDPDETFSPGPVLEIGCASKRSISRVDQTMAWVDDRKRIVASDGRSVVVLSDKGIAGTLDSVSTFSDCWSFRAKMGAHDLTVFVFPTDGRSFAWDENSSTWSEWRRMDRVTQQWKPWAPSSYLWIPVLNKHLVGMPDGTIAELALDAHSDLNDPIAWRIRTGFKEVEKRRHAVEARFTCRRGSASAEAQIGVTWRDDLGAFEQPIQCPLGEPGDYEADVTVSPAGSPYRRRQWELSGSGDDAYLIAGGKETYEEAEF